MSPLAAKYLCTAVVALVLAVILAGLCAVGCHNVGLPPSYGWRSFPIWLLLMGALVCVATQTTDKC